ncbi:hypothetical protein F4781DRAFT_405006 [Annulohypoxylon bovei var. microspora]|nr:hypothetical protein F4781DRAFT_405006 [Annulohypoxylon bovei var. microspora]
MANANRRRRQSNVQRTEVGESSNSSRQTTSSQSATPPQQSALWYGHVNYIEATDILDAAREGEETLNQPHLKIILEKALRDIWERILRQPDQYVMTRDEFAIFNFFQNMPLDKETAAIAAKARANYWANVWGPQSL